MSYLKNTAGQFLYFAMIAKADGSAITSGTVNGYRSLDGGSQAAVTGTISHKGNGQWELALSQADINADEAGYLFTHTSGIPVSISIVTDSKKVGSLNDLSAAAVNAEVDTALADYDPPTKAEMDAGLAGLNDLDSTAVQSAAAAALTAYDPPTKTELDAALAGLNDPDAAAIADAVWDEALAGHATAGSTGAALTAASSAGDPWATPLPGAYGPGTAGQILGDNLDTAVSGLSTFDPATETVDVGKISGDAAAADNLESMLDGTGGGTLSLGKLAVVSTDADAAVKIENSVGNGLAIQASAATKAAMDLEGGNAGLYARGTQSGSMGAFFTGNGSPVNGIYGALVGNVAGNVAGTVGGIAGTIQTLDALDTAQDAQHAITQAAIAALPAFDPLTDSVDVGSVGGTAVTGPGDLKSHDPVTTTFVAYGDDLTPARSRYYISVPSADVPGSLGANLIGAVFTVIDGASKGTTRMITGYGISGSDTKLRFSRAINTPPSAGDHIAFFHAVSDPDYDNTLIAMAVWTALPSSYLGAGRAAQLLYDLDAGTTGLDPAAIADAVWDELLAGHAISGSAGAALAGAGAASDPWATAVPGAYAAGTAGYLIGTFLDAAISSRSDFDAGADQVDVGAIATAVAQAIADEVLKRGVANVEDTANAASLAAIILATLESSISGSTWTIRKTAGGTFATKTVTTDAGAEPIVGVD